MISVCMPTYNRGYCIQHAISSILKQTVRDFELIIVDDGSTDNTARVVDSFVSDKIKYFRLPKTANISYLRNYACKEAKGELIVVQDSDDISYPDRLERIWKKQKETGADVIYHDIYARGFDPDHESVIFEYREVGAYDKDRLIQQQYIPGQIAYTKAAWEKTPYNEAIEVMDDMMFLIELALAENKFAYIDRPLYEYNFFKDSININAEADGRRFSDTKKIIDVLKTKYGMEARGELRRWEQRSGKIIDQKYVQ